MIGVLNDQQIDSFLRSQLVGRIGCYAFGKAYVVPTTYYYDGAFIYGHAYEDQKIKMLRENPVTCFEVDRIEDMANWQSVIINGKYEELEGEGATAALGLLTNRLMPFKSGESSLPKYGMEKLSTRIKPAAQLVAYRITIEEKSGRFEKG